MKVIKLDSLLHDIENGDAPVSGCAVVDWLRSKAYDYEPMPYVHIKYPKDSKAVLKE